MTNDFRPVRVHAPRTAALRVAGLLAAAVALAAPAARGQGMMGLGGKAGSQALAQVPSDALVVLRINHLDATNKKVSDLLQQLGVVDLVPQAKDPLKAFSDATGVPAASLDATRDAVVFMPNGAGGKEEDEEGDQPQAVVLLPVSDYAKFVGGLTGAKTEGEVTTGRFKDAPEDTFVAHWGDYAAVTPRKDLLKGKHDGLTLAGPAAAEMDAKDVCLYVNFPVLKTALAPKLAAAKKEAAEQADDRMGDADAGKKAVAHAAMDQAFNVADSFLRDAQPTTVGLTIGKAGVSANLVVAFTKGSYLGTLLGQMKTTTGPLLAGLPEEKYLFFAGGVADPKMTAKLIDDLIAPITPKLAGMGDTGAKVKQMVDLYRSAAASTDAWSVGGVVPTAALGQGSLIRNVGVIHADAARLMSAQEQTAELQSPLMDAFGLKEANFMKTTVTKGAKTVGGVSFDQVQSVVDPNANNGQAAQAEQVLKYIYGPDGQTALIGAVDAHTLVSSMGVDDVLLAAVVDAAKGNKDVLSAQVKAVDAELPKARSAVAYVDLAQFFATGISYAHAMNVNLPVQLPPNLPPVGVSIGADAEQQALKVDGFVPTSLMQSLIQAGFQIYLNLPHGGGGM